MPVVNVYRRVRAITVEEPGPGHAGELHVRFVHADGVFRLELDRLTAERFYRELQRKLGSSQAIGIAKP